MNYTPWMSVMTKPVRVGVYERVNGPMRPHFQHWNGRFWGFWCLNAEAAAKPSNARMQSSWQVGEWRGLAKKP